MSKNLHETSINLQISYSHKQKEKEVSKKILSFLKQMPICDKEQLSGKTLIYELNLLSHTRYDPERNQYWILATTENKVNETQITGNRINTNVSSHSERKVLNDSISAYVMIKESIDEQIYLLAPLQKLFTCLFAPGLMLVISIWMTSLFQTLSPPHPHRG